MSFIEIMRAVQEGWKQQQPWLSLGEVISDLGEPFTSLHKSYLQRNYNIREKLRTKKKKMQAKTDDRSDYAAGGF